MPKTAMQYKLAVLKLGLEQLDVYRYEDHDEVRLRERDSGRVFVVKLPRFREMMDVNEYVEFSKKAVSKMKK